MFTFQSKYRGLTISSFPKVEFRNSIFSTKDEKLAKSLRKAIEDGKVSDVFEISSLVSVKPEVEVVAGPRQSTEGATK